ncbi:glyoxylate reductase/hydroxypyruvate reductase [Haematobia irritans]|uniref:glyoxylate reductase/hydroxypyruvate reductase n=1 Tax=Haematobia irritans TaxID=7368 RepID=UPI003F4F93DC
MSSAARRLYKVLVTHPEVPVPALDYLRQKGCQTIICENVPPERSDILKKLPGVDAIFWASYQPLNGEILDAAGTQLKAVSTMTSGIDYVDLEEFKRRQMPLGHTPGVVKNAVADLAIGLMIAAGRFFHAGRKDIESSHWETERYDWLMGQEIRDSTIGFLGFGGIGQAIAKRLQCWDVRKFIYHTRNRRENDGDFRAHHVTFDELLSESDFLIVACPLTSETKGKFNAEAFSKMKRNCVFVNVGRGGIVDQDALMKALKSGQIFSAGLDVMSPEPLPPDHPLLKIPNCVIIPHLGTQTWKTTTEMAMVAAQNIINALEGKPMISPAY